MAHFIKRFGVGIITLVAVYAIVHYLVTHNRKPGSMTVVEAQAMDMAAMAANTPVGSIPVAAEEVAWHDFAPTVSYTGTVAAFNDEDIYPRVTGTLSAVFVYPGDRVSPGQVVARLDSAELTSRLNEAAAATEAAKHDFRISGEERRQAVAMKRAAEGKVTGLRASLSESQAQLSAAEAMRDQADKEQEAAQASTADADANAVSMKADADYWAAEIVREEKLFKAGAVSREELDRERSMERAARAKLAQAEAGRKEKAAMLAAAKSKIRQAESGIAAARAKVEQMRADITTAQAEVTSADANVAMNVHHTAHRSAQAEQMEAQEQTARIVRGYTEIRATQGGIVSDRLVSPGTLVQPGMAILKIKNSKQVRLQANVPDVDLAGIRIGSAVSVTKPNDPGYHLNTHVTSISSAANAQTRTVTVEALTQNADGRLRAGEYISLEIATSAPRRALTVPLGALRRDVDQKPFVWTMALNESKGGKTIYTCVMHPEVISDKPGKCPKCGMDLVPKNKTGKLTAHRVYVKLGPDDGKRAVVESGLQEGQQVLYRGHENLNEGDPVSAVDWAASGPKSMPESSGEIPNMPGMKTDGTDRSKPGGMESMPGMGGR